MKNKNDVPLYSSRITNTYLEYIEKFYPHVDIDEMLKYSDMKRYEVEDAGHWFTQKQVDRFHEKAVKDTGNPNLPREAGRLTASSQSAGAVRQYGLGLLNPMSVYLMVETFYRIMTRGANAIAKKLGPNKVEIVVTPEETVSEKPYQCLNRIGTFESLSKPFTRKYARVTETNCYHKGDRHCRYEIEWEKTPALLLKLIRNYVAISAILAIPIIFFLFSGIFWIISTLSLISAILFISLLTELIEKKELYKTIKSQGNAAKELVNEINTRHNNAMLIQDIGQITSTIVHVDKLVESALKIIMQYLSYARGMVLLSNPTYRKLTLHSGIGYGDFIPIKLGDIKKGNSVDSDETIVYNVFKNQKPYLWNRSDGDHDIDIFTAPHHDAKQTQAFICVPIIYEKESLGVLIVETTEKNKQLTKSDMSLLIGIASQIAVGINNARSFEEMRNIKEQIQRSRDDLEVRVEERTNELEKLNLELNAEIEERQKTENKLRSSIKKMNVLIKEVHHRVKNNLQVISSLFDMIKRRAKHPETIDCLSEAHAKIFTMSLIHSQLYQSDRFDEINMGRFIRDFVTQLAQFYPEARNISLKTKTEDVYLSVTQAIPTALALNEIVSNSFKHAFGGMKKGSISTTLKKGLNQNILLLVNDNGMGIPKHVDIDHTESLGMKLIRNLITVQLKGQLRIDCTEGTSISIDFPIVAD